ncbi:phenylalanine-tRNA ligase [Epithele typhae]|uniref:phenylalanine-tRNA ligase n=1 Tax=Epithele typhae TaxID=378194 RepID=UPI002007E809|nr:phenylalanine-tRNA ligase [Epithele typhae]KAH9943388.1 phenylalanine-tRNA ligase [Epithele typhae]
MAEAIQQLILDTLDKEGSIKDTRTLFLPATRSLQLPMIPKSLFWMITYTTQETLSHVLTQEGAQIALQGSHEARGDGKPITPKDLQEKVGADIAKVGQGQAFKNKWIGKEGDGLVKLLMMREVDSTGTLKAGEKTLATLGNASSSCNGQWFTVHKGSQFSTSTAKPETDLTADMLTSYGAWKTATYKKYNFEADGVPPNGGALHPLLKVREEIRNIFLEMGFAEMPTSSFVESGFWCFDALFVPQQHPAREVQDTFYLSDPAEYYETVSRVHEHGGFGSTGYRAPWSHDESRKLLLRTHTTASSGADGFRPAKLFSIDRVFRNETMDATHLAEFHQVEGVVADRGLTLADLIGFMRVFFKKMGIENIRFKPAYNPYTEPSLEIFAFHPQLKKWVEVGNSGMFRPEMLEPMGFPKDVHVHGWGISLERPTMIRYGINNIRTLVGHKVSLESVENSPAVRF